jgi:hypothetical protein
MDPAIAESIGPVLVLLGVCGTILMGVKLRYSHKEKMRLGEGGSVDTQRLAEEMAALRDAVHGMREDYAELYERVEFAERLLTKGSAEGES